MRETTVELFSADPLGLLQAAQEERVLVTRAGKPLALVVGVECKDQEDWDLEMSPEFWRMIQQRRNQPTVPLRDVESALLIDESFREDWEAPGMEDYDA
jgi:antitoxin (DNA-binding transcriptional repressor) of toxin-antitoxin stability system